MRASRDGSFVANAIGAPELPGQSDSVGSDPGADRNPIRTIESSPLRSRPTDGPELKSDRRSSSGGANESVANQSPLATDSTRPRC